MIAQVIQGLLQALWQIFKREHEVAQVKHSLGQAKNDQHEIAIRQRGAAGDIAKRLRERAAARR